MKTKILLKMGLIAMCFMAGFVEMGAQELFQKEYGYSNFNSQVRLQLPSTVIQTRDSGFASINTALNVLGSNHYNYAGMFLKTDRYGEVQWSRYFRKSSSYETINPNSVIQVRDGSYYICGRFTEDEKYYPFLLKTDKAGNKLWIKTYSAIDNGPIIFRNLAETSNGNIFIAGHNLLSKIDANGNYLWAKRYSQGYNAIRKAGDSTFILSGNGLAEIDTAGNILWAKNYDFPASFVQPLKSGGYALVTNRGAIVSKTDKSGNILWSKIYQFNQLHPSVIDELLSGEIIVAGTYGTPSEGQFGWFTILDSLGNIKSVKFLQRSGGNAFSGVRTSDSCFVLESNIVKNGKSDLAALLKIDSKGNTSCPEKEKVMYLTIEDYPIRDSVLAVTDSLIQITASDLPCEFISVDITATDLCALTNILEEDQTGDFQLYPNPASGVCTILLKEDIQNADVAIIDINGKTLYRKFLKNAEGEIMLDISPLQPGVYFVKVAAGGKEFVRKIIVE